MDEKLQLGSPQGIQLELQRTDGQGKEPGLLWAHGRLLIGGEPVWERDDGGRLEWTWIDLLEWLGRYWKYLLYEQSLPFNEKTLSMSTLLRDLQRRWEDMPEERAEEEEEQALRFLNRHDMAYGFKGIFLPSLYLLRQGNLMEVSLPALKTEMRPSLDTILADLETIGDRLADMASEHRQPRADAAVSQWRNRLQFETDTVVHLMTGLSEDELSVVADNDKASFWELEAEDPVADTEILAAARMTLKVLAPEQQRKLLQQIKTVPAQETPKVDNLSHLIRKKFSPHDKPHDQGYWAANWLRQALDIPPDDRVEPVALLQEWGVRIDSLELHNTGLDALACWGKRHGPVIFLDQQDGSAATMHGKRSTLAHEICHLLLDRHDALPVAEVLNGHTPERLEKRARAFAAEFLLPRSSAASRVQDEDELEQAVRSLSKAYEVSEALVCWQIYNSEASAALDQAERQWLWDTGHATSV